MKLAIFYQAKRFKSFLIVRLLNGATVIQRRLPTMKTGLTKTGNETSVAATTRVTTGNTSLLTPAQTSGGFGVSNKGDK